MLISVLDIFTAAKINNNYIYNAPFNCRLLALGLYNFKRGYGWANNQGSLYRKPGGPYEQDKKKSFGTSEVDKKEIKESGVMTFNVL